jgi:hypothetical protein
MAVGDDCCVYRNKTASSVHDADVGVVTAVVSPDERDINRRGDGLVGRHRLKELFKVAPGSTETKYAFYKGYFFELVYINDAGVHTLRATRRPRRK